MKDRLLSFMKKLSPLAIYTAIMTMIATAPAFAAAGSAGLLNLSATSNALQSVIDLAQGPVAKVIAILCVIAGAVAVSQGREMNEGLRNLGIIAITIGLLIGVTNLFGTSVGALI